MSRAVRIVISSALFFYQCQHTEPNAKDTIQQSAYYPVVSKDSVVYINEGIKLAKQMYAGILQRLKTALDQQGYYEAVKYCNHNALPLTDSLAIHYGIKAKRTSLKLRNPANAPDELEKQVLEMYQKTLSKQPTVYKTSEGIRFFTPIYVAEFCLNCHGKPYENIPDVTMRAIQELYPNDEAKNYEIYDIRGIWSITFPENYPSKLNTNNP